MDGAGAVIHAGSSKRDRLEAIAVPGMFHMFIFLFLMWTTHFNTLLKHGFNGKKKKEREREREDVIERHFMNTSSSDLCKAKEMKGGQRQMEVCTVSCHGGQLKAHRGAGANTHPQLIPEFLSARLQPPVPSLIFISASVMRTKESTHSFAPPPPWYALPPFFFTWSLRARLAGLISNCDLTTWWKDWHACTLRTRRARTHTRVCTQTHICGGEEDTGQFC